MSGEVDAETDIHRVVKPDGSIGWQEWTDQVIRDESGRVVEFQSVGRDITMRKQAEEALRESEAIYRQAIEEGLVDIFMDAGYCVTNPTCGACLGMSNGVLAEGEVCASTTNRNFNGRMGKGGMVHLMSPASAAAAGVAGRLVDPRKYL